MLSYKEWIEKRSYFLVKAVDVIQLKVIIKHKQTQMVVHFLANLDSRFLDNTHCDRTLIREQMQALDYFQKRKCFLTIYSVSLKQVLMVCSAVFFVEFPLKVKNLKFELVVHRCRLC